MFSSSAQATAVALLKAINNRKHIYFVTLKLDYNVLKKRQKAREEETGKRRFYLFCDEFPVV